MYTLAGSEDAIVASVAIVGGLALAFVGVVMSIWRKMRIEKEREVTRREVAAYVAEGSITSEDAQKILEAGTPIWQRKGIGVGRG